MMKSKFTDAQIAFILQQANEGTSVTEVCRKAGSADSVCMLVGENNSSGDPAGH